MTRFFLTLLAVVFSMALHAQGQGYPQGVYLSFEDIKSKTPSSREVMQIVEYVIYDLNMNKNSEYALESADKNKSLPKKAIFAYSDGNALYLSGLKFQNGARYSKLDSEGNRFLYFKGGLAKDKAARKRQKETHDLDNSPTAAYAFGAVGAVIAAAAGPQGQAAALRVLYVYDKRTDKVWAVDAVSMQEILSQRKDILDKFNKEFTKNSERTQRKYLEVLDHLDSYTEK